MSVEFLGIGAVTPIENRLSPVITGFGQPIISSYRRPLFVDREGRLGRGEELE
jgi:hypothetical protein